MQYNPNANVFGGTYLYAGTIGNNIPTTTLPPGGSNITPPPSGLTGQPMGLLLAITYSS